MKLTFFNMLDRIAELDGHSVEVSGLLAATLETAYLIAPETSFEHWNRERVLLDWPGLPELLLTSVPARVGGELAYFEPAVVRGRLRSGGSDGVAATLNDLELLVVVQAGKRYSVALAP